MKIIQITELHELRPGMPFLLALGDDGSLWFGVWNEGVIEWDTLNLPE